jgi:HD-like signal output (HDOD) protein
MRHEWNMVFTESGQDALDHLSKEPFDVVVTDIKMPGIDGVRLLTEIMKRHPQIVRIILSAQLDEQLIMKSTRVSHQYLYKPCDSETLKSTIAGACALHRQLTNDSFKRVVSKIDSLPSLPSLYAEIMGELDSKNASIQRVGEIIAKDVGMTAKILHLVNSAFFGVPRHISSPAQATTLLGLDTIKSLVLSVQIFSQFDQNKIPVPFLEQLWKHSMTAGSFAKTIAKEENQDKVNIDYAFMAGMLHDLGKLVLAANFPEQYREILDAIQKENTSLLEREYEMFGATHSEVGAYLIGLWGLPGPIIEALAFHHCPSRHMGRQFIPLTAVHIANVLDHEDLVSDREEDGFQVDSGYLSDLNLADRVPVWIKICRDALQGGETDES